MAAYQLDDLQLFLAAGAQAAVAEIEVIAEGGAEDAGGLARFAFPLGRRAARSHLAAGEIDHADAQAVGDRAGDGSAARQLRVVGVSGDEEEIDVVVHRFRFERKWGDGEC